MRKKKNTSMYDLSEYEKGEFKLSNIKSQCMYSQLEEKILLNKIKSRMAYEIYESYKDIFDNANNIDDTKATKIVLEIQQMLIDWNTERSDDPLVDSLFFIDKITEIYSKNNIYVGKDHTPYRTLEKL